MQNNEKTHQHIIVIGGFLIDAKYILMPHLSQFSNILVDFIDINSLHISNNVETTVNELIKQITKLTQSTKVHNITIIAYSFGGILAIHCHQLIKYCYKLILINTTAKFIEDTSWYGIKNTEYIKLSKKLQTVSLENFIHYFIRLAYYPYQINKDVINQIIAMKYDKNTLLNLLYLMKEVNIIATLNNIKIPTIMLYSRYDILIHYNHLKNDNIIAISINNSSHLNFDNKLLSIIMDYI